MKESLLKSSIRSLYFRPNAVRTIQFGPLRGMKFKVSPITGLSPWYSGSEREHHHVFREYVKGGYTVIDIGANWGLHTLYLSHLVGNAGKVIALEPFPPAYEELVWHVKTNQCNNVETKQVAASDEDGEAFFIAGENASTGRLAFESTFNNLEQKTQIVAVMMLDTLIANLQLVNVDLVKIDVEGAEGKVLAGAEMMVERFAPIFVIDLHTPDQDIRVAQWLSGRGYRLQRLSGPPIRQVDVGWPHPNGVWGSILAIPGASKHS